MYQVPSQDVGAGIRDAALVLEAQYVTTQPRVTAMQVVQVMNLEAVTALHQPPEGGHDQRRLAFLHECVRFGTLSEEQLQNMIRAVKIEKSRQEQARKDQMGRGGDNQGGAGGAGNGVAT